MTAAPTTLQAINPQALGAPRGYSNGMVTPAGARLLFVAGQSGAADGAAAGGDFVQQFETALARIVTVVRAAGGVPAQIVRMTVYVTCVDDYRRSRGRLSAVWRRHMDAHYPAMALVEVRGLVDRASVVEIDATAALPPTADAAEAAATDRSVPVEEPVL